MIPKILQEHINTAAFENTCLIGSVLPSGYAQITPRGSTMVFDDDHIALWERGKGSTTASMQDGSKVTIPSYLKGFDSLLETLLPYLVERLLSRSSVSLC